MRYVKDRFVFRNVVEQVTTRLIHATEVVKIPFRPRNENPFKRLFLYKGSPSLSEGEGQIRVLNGYIVLA